LVVPFSGDRFLLTQTQVSNRKFNANTSALYSALDQSTWASLPNPFIFDNEVSDPDAQYDPVTGEFTCVSAGRYEFKMSGSYYWSAVGGSYSGGSVSYLNVRFHHQRGASNIAVYTYQVFNNGGNSLTAGNSSASVSFTVTSQTLDIQAGDKVWIQLGPMILGTLTGGQYAQFNLTSGAAFTNTVTDASPNLAESKDEEKEQVDTLIQNMGSGMRPKSN